MRYFSKQLLEIVFTSLLAISCSSHSTAISGNTDVHSLASMPFKLYGNRIYFEVRVNSSDPVRFMLDTGASASVINRGRAAELHIRMVEGGEVSYAGAGEGMTRIALANNVSFGLGGVDLPVETAYGLQMDDLESALGVRVFGVLGYDLFSRYVVEVDFGAAMIKLYNPRDYGYSGPGQMIPLKMLNGWALVPAGVTGPGTNQLHGDFKIDTGQGSAIQLNSPFVEKHRLLQHSQTVPILSQGVGGEFRSLMGRLEAFQLGRFRFEHPLVIYSQASSGATAQTDHSGSIGGPMLSRFKIVFDYRRDRMFLEPLATLSAPFEEDMSGTFLIAEGRDLNVMRVRRVYENSAASDAGLRQDDVIKSIDDKPAAVFDLERIRQMFTKPGQIYRLGVERGGQPLQINIRMRSRL